MKFHTLERHMLVVCLHKVFIFPALSITFGKELQLKLSKNIIHAHFLRKASSVCISAWDFCVIVQNWNTELSFFIPST